MDIAIVDGRGLVFDVDQIRELRERYHICGTLTGVLPQFPQQNLFMGLPLQLLPEDVKYLVDQGAVTLRDNARAQEALYQNAEPTQPEKDASGLVKIPNTSELKDVATVAPDRVDQPDPAAYGMYLHLMSSGFFLMPGLRFGCHYMAYPGDPMRYHAHFNAVGKDYDEEFDILDIVGGGRLATAVKKCLVLGAQAPTGEYRAFSVEWAGFG